MIALASPAMPGRIPFDRSMFSTGCFTELDWIPITRPQRFSRMCGTTARTKRTKFSVTTSNPCRQSSSVKISELADGRAARVVDQDIDAAEPIDRRGHDALDAGRGREVRRHDEYLAAGLRADVSGRCLKIRLGARADRDPGALAREREGRRLAQAPARRTDDRDLAFQP